MVKDRSYAIAVQDGDKRVIVRIGPGVQADLEEADYHFKSVTELATAYVEAKNEMDAVALGLNGG